MICSFNFLIFLAVCLNISTVINIKILTNSNQQTPSYKFTSHIAAFRSVVLITEMLEICIQTSYDQNVQLILKSYLPVVYGTTLNYFKIFSYCTGNKTFPMYQSIPEYLTLTNTNLYTGRRLAKLYLMIMPTNKYGHHHNELNNR